MADNVFDDDGIVYLGASALGFALLENVAYVAQYGFGTGVLRAFSAIPLHMFTGVIMGYQVGLARLAGSPVVARRRVARGFFAAWLLHGLYDAFALSGQSWVLLVLPIIGGVILAGTLFLRRGRALSLARWSEAGPLPVPVDGPVRRRRPARWMAVMGRLLLGVCLLFWVLLVVGVVTQEGAAPAGDTLLGGALLTFIPLGLGLLLEVSYQRRHSLTAEGQVVVQAESHIHGLPIRIDSQRTFEEVVLVSGVSRHKNRHARGRKDHPGLQPQRLLITAALIPITFDLSYRGNQLEPFQRR